MCFRFAFRLPPTTGSFGSISFRSARANAWRPRNRLKMRTKQEKSCRSITQTCSAVGFPRPANGTSHEPAGGLPTIQRLTQTKFMGSEQVRKEHGAFHEPSRRSGVSAERRSSWQQPAQRRSAETPATPVHGHNVEATHETAPLTPSLSPSEGERVSEGRVRGWFMVPMRAQKRKEATHVAGEPPS